MFPMTVIMHLIATVSASGEVLGHDQKTKDKHKSGFHARRLLPTD